jgi:thymidylate synthase (FAD)
MCAGSLPWFTQHIVQRYPILFPEFRDASFEEYRRIKTFAVQLHPSELETPLEKLVHCDRTVIYTCDRGVTHEIVRHRPASYCQESTRYCNYSGDKFGRSITVIEPCYLGPGSDPKKERSYLLWMNSCAVAEETYFYMLDHACSPQEARAVLPSSLKTELAMTTNLKEWRHFLKLRCAPGAHPQMREVACQLPERFHKEEPDLFNDIREELTE